MEVINALGRRKTAVARVYLTKGKGNISINKREMTDFSQLTFFKLKFTNHSLLQELKVNMT